MMKQPQHKLCKVLEEHENEEPKEQNQTDQEQQADDDSAEVWQFDPAICG